MIYNVLTNIGSFLGSILSFFFLISYKLFMNDEDMDIS